MEWDSCHQSVNHLADMKQAMTNVVQRKSRHCRSTSRRVTHQSSWDDTHLESQTCHAITCSNRLLLNQQPSHCSQQSSHCSQQSPYCSQQSSLLSYQPSSSVIVNNPQGTDFLINTPSRSYREHSDVLETSTPNAAGCSRCGEEAADVSCNPSDKELSSNPNPTSQLSSCCHLQSILGRNHSNQLALGLSQERFSKTTTPSIVSDRLKDCNPQHERSSQFPDSRVYHRVGWVGSLRRWVATLITALTLLQMVPSSGPIVYQKQMSERVIVTRYGKVRGIKVEFPNRYLEPVDAYFGLRYADLENGNMRFMPPKNPKEQWTNTRVAIVQQPPCPQPVLNEKDYQHVLPDSRVTHLRNITPFLTGAIEDCLTLNLYVPRSKWNETTPVPVMVFIHGETYDIGTGNAYDGSVLSSFGNVIVVTLNYRLGVLGFLTTLDQEAMGNLGLLDITQALLWLQENIASFNGDPKRVTLFGHGHGAALVNLLLLSPFVSEGRGPFFQRAIIQSGSALATWAISYDPMWCTEKLAINVNCSTFIGDSHNLVNCLRQRSVDELLNAAPEAPKYYSCFAPVTEEYTVLPREVERLIKERNSKFSSVPVMFGITKNEAYSYLKQQEIHKGLSDLRKTQIIRTYVQNVFRYHRQKIFEILDHQYTDWTQPANYMSNRNNILELLSDGQYVAPLMKTANYHSETADTYLYAFSYSTQSEEDSEDLQGIHGDELPYVFGSPLVDGLSPFPSAYTSAEKMMSEAVMTYWTNFAKTGDPNQPWNQSSVHGGKVHNRFAGMKWPRYDQETQEYMHFSRRPAVRHHYRGQKLAMWLDLIPKINVADGSDPSSHQLSNYKNKTTFDDYHLLIPPFDNIFPSPPPMPPISPILLNTSEDPSTPSDIIRNTGPKNNMPVVPPDSVDQDNSTLDGVDGVKQEPEEVLTTAPLTVSHNAGEHITNSLSITVAVGCTLLFLNLLIFAAVYYQRMRIRKLRQGREPEDPDEVKLNRKLEREANRNCLASPETDSLMFSAGSGTAEGAGSFLAEGTSPAGCDECPVRELTTTGQSTGTLGRRSPPQNGKKISSGTLSRSSADSSNAYNYTAVPTHTTSPLHRSQLQQPHHAGGLTSNSASSIPHFSSSRQPMPLHTFANNFNSLSKGPRFGASGGSAGLRAGFPSRSATSGVSEAADTGLYQVINKTAPSQGSGSTTNAITIV